MSDATPDTLIRIAEHYYPRGFPPEADDPRLPKQAFERTPEYVRWLGLWGQAPVLERWRALKSRWRAEFPHLELLDFTRPRAASCYLSLVYFRAPLPDGATRVTRLVGAVSLLAPLYLVYFTAQTVWPGRRFSPPEIDFSQPEHGSAEPGGGEGTSTGSTHLRPYALWLARLFEQEWGARPFPLALANFPLPHLRIFHLNQEPPTLLNAFFLEQPEHLP
ncbi:MAG TPA: hypothetical protein VE153_36740 [Myxococcus sp.]|nr:hypothetical protein [Myxococcus sp.]